MTIFLNQILYELNNNEMDATILEYSYQGNQRSYDCVIITLLNFGNVAEQPHKED